MSSDDIFPNRYLGGGTGSSLIATVNSHPSLPVKNTKIRDLRVMYDLSAAHWQSRQAWDPASGDMVSVLKKK